MRCRSLLLSVVALAACREAAGPTVPLTIDAEPFVLSWGETRQIAATAATSDWSSSDTTVVTVDAQGVVTARRGGAAYIRARSGGGADSVMVSVDLRFLEIAPGFVHTCGISTTRRVVCWGRNNLAQLGLPDAENSAVVVPIPAPIRDTARYDHIASGGSFDNQYDEPSFSCGLTGASTRCWGPSRYGQTGQFITPGLGDWDGPSPVSNAPAFVAISAGGVHTCGLTTGGGAYCWGAGSLLAVSRTPSSCSNLPQGGGSPCSSVPLPVETDIAFATLSAGGRRTCGLDRAGAAYCWSDSPKFPTRVDGPAFKEISLGGSHTCALDALGAAWCWGTLPLDTVPHPAPQRIAGLPVLVSIAAGQDFTCGVGANGVAYCWGANANGQLGDGTASSRATPDIVKSSATFVRVVTSAVSQFACGLTSSGAAYCWGLNTRGQLGNGSLHSSPLPIRVSPPLTHAQ